MGVILAFVKNIGLVIVLAGMACTVAGGVLVFGPVALLVAGPALIVTGLVADWEALDGEPAQPTP